MKGYVLLQGLKSLVQKAIFKNSLWHGKVILLHIQAHGESEVLPVP
jgi:hypothetical protein